MVVTARGPAVALRLAARSLDALAGAIVNEHKVVFVLGPGEAQV